MILLDQPYALVEGIEEKKLVKITWKGKCTSDQYREIFLMMLEKQPKLKLTRYLSDIRNQSVISPEDRKWFENVALPRAVEQGLKAAAVVFSGNVFKKYYLNVILASTNKFKLPFKVFLDENEADAWLMEH